MKKEDLQIDDVKISPKTPLLFQQTQPKEKKSFGKKDFLLHPKELKSLADSGDANAQLLIGLSLYHGMNECVIDKVKSYKYIGLAAKNQTSPAGLCAQGLCYKNAICDIKIKNLIKAKECLTEAASQNYIPAKHLLAVILEEEENLNKSEGKSAGFWAGESWVQGSTQVVHHTNESRRSLMIQLYTQCAEEGYPPSQNRLGVCYEQGKGVTKDEKEAFKLYKMAAEAGLASGKCYLGWSYQLGTGITQNDSEARKWYQAAIEQGDSTAKERLSTLPCCSCLIL
jgi:uncharacterized protein